MAVYEFQEGINNFIDDLAEYQSKMDFVVASVGALASQPEADFQVYTHEASMEGLYNLLIALGNDLAGIIGQARKLREGE